MESNRVLFSIIIPTYQRAHLLKQTLDSIIAQTYTNWQCIVVDDGSTDNTFQVVSDYISKDNRFQFYNRPKDLLKGPNSCRNYGFEKSTGTHVKRFDSDDIMLSNCLAEIAGLIQKKNFDLIVSEIEFINKEEEKLNKKHRYYSEDLIADYLAGKVTFYVFQTWHRSFLKKQTEYFDAKISNLDDWDFNLRMLYQNPTIGYIHKPLIQYKVHSESLAHEIEKLNFEEISSELAARKKHFDLLLLNKKANPQILNNFIRNRLKYFFIHALQMKDGNRIKYLKMLLQKQFELKDFTGIVKTIIAFFIYSVFNRGYKFLQKI